MQHVAIYIVIALFGGVLVWYLVKDVRQFASKVGRAELAAERKARKADRIEAARPPLGQVWRGKRAKRRAMMEAGAQTWSTLLDIPEVIEVLKAAAKGVARGSISGSPPHVLSPNTTRIEWEAAPSLIPQIWFTTELVRNADRTNIALEIQRAKFRRTFPFPWTMTGGSTVDKFVRRAKEQMP